MYCNYYTRDTQNNWRVSKLFLEKDNTMKKKEEGCETQMYLGSMLGSTIY